VTNRALLVFAFIVLLAPLYFLITGSFQDIHGLFVMPPRLWPRNPTAVNYEWVLSLPLLHWLRNTGYVFVTTVTLSVLISVTGGYAFAFYRFPLKRFLWIIALAGIMVPRMSLIIPQFVVLRKLNLNGTLLAAILPAAYMPIGLYLARTYFETVPKSLLESARIDGANELQILSRVVAPVSRPIVTAIALFAGLHSLGDFMWQMLQLQHPRVHTLLVGLMRAVMLRGGESATNINPVGRSMAVAVVLAIPMLLLFIIANRYFTTALGGATKE
jgi:ABC-type glycerol-3-phosphate transport system permease component